jgi:hypothetical protein
VGAAPEDGGRPALRALSVRFISAPVERHHRPGAGPVRRVVSSSRLGAPIAPEKTVAGAPSRSSSSSDLTAPPRAGKEVERAVAG